MNAPYLTPDARRGVAAAEIDPDGPCLQCGRLKATHTPGAWAGCLDCGALVHRYGNGGRTRCPRHDTQAADHHVSRDAALLALAAKVPHPRAAPTVQGVSAAGWSSRCSGCGRQWGAVTKAPGSHLCDCCAKRGR